MKHVPSCRSLALITAATGTVLVTTAFGVLPATAVTNAPEPVSATTVSSSSAPDTTTAGVDAAAVAPAATPTDQDTAAPVATPAAAAAPETPATAPAAPAASTAPAVPAAPTTPAATPVATAPAAPLPAEETPAAETPAAAEPTATEPATAPSYTEGTSASSPKVLPTVTAGSRVFADLRAQDADGATYTLTETDGSAARLNEGLSFRNGFLKGTATVAGTFTLRVTATTEAGTATQWIEQTVEPSAVVGVGVVVRDVPAAEDGSYTWIEGDQTGSTDPVRVTTGGSITLVPWTIDEHGNSVQATDRAEVWASADTDRVEQGADGFTVTFADAGTHTVWVSVDGVCAEFSVAVADEPAGPPTTPTEPTTPAEPTVPTVPVDPAPAPAEPAAPVDTTPQDGGVAPVVRVTPTADDASAPVTARSTTTAAHSLAYTGADTAAPIGWAAGLLAAGAAVIGIRRLRRARHRA